MRLATLRLLPLAAPLAIVMSVTPAAAADPIPLDVSVRARALQPGELARIVVRSPEPLGRVEGTFRGEPLFFVPDRPATATTPETWSAWAVLDLDWRPGALDVVVTGWTPAGSRLSGARDVEMIGKSFPTQELKVEGKYVDPPKAEMVRIERERKRLAEVYASRRPIPPPRQGFTRPVDGIALGEFGSRRIFNGKPRAPHSGLDLRAATGTPVRSAGPGLVALAQDLYFSGNTVIVDHGGGLFTVYAHLSRIGVEEGAVVEAGQLLGDSGATGRVTGPHLHWGGKLGPRIFDPSALLDPALFGDGGTPATDLAPGPD